MAKLSDLASWGGQSRLEWIVNLCHLEKQHEQLSHASTHSDGRPASLCESGDGPMTVQAEVIMNKIAVKSSGRVLSSFHL